MPALQFSDCAAHSREKMHTPASIWLGKLSETLQRLAQEN
jgi:hypothetical protein